jgi:hypothetical protein
MPKVLRAPQKDVTDLLLAAVVSFAVFLGFALFILSTRP